MLFFTIFFLWLVACLGWFGWLVFIFSHMWKFDSIKGWRCFLMDTYSSQQMNPESWFETGKALTHLSPVLYNF